MTRSTAIRLALTAASALLLWAVLDWTAALFGAVIGWLITETIARAER